MNSEKQAHHRHNSRHFKNIIQENPGKTLEELLKLIDGELTRTEQQRLTRTYTVMQAMSEGAKSIPEIKKRTTLGYSTIRDIMIGEELPIHQHRLSLEQRLEQLRSLIAANTPAYVEDVAEASGLSVSYLVELREALGGVLPLDHRPFHREGGTWRTKEDYQRLLELVDSGTPMKLMKSSLNLTQEGVRLAIKHSGLTPLYKQRQAEAKHRKNRQLPHERQRVANILNHYLHQQAHQESWALGKAIEWYHARTRSADQFGSVHEFFERFDQAKRKGEKKSLKELTRGLPISFPVAGRMLNEVGQAPLYSQDGRWTTRKCTNREQKEAIQRSFRLQLSAKDIAYFIQVKAPVAASILRELGPRPVYRPFMGSGRREDYGTIAIASQVYEAQDCGFTIDETCELIGITPAVLHSLRDQRAKLERKIVRDLRVLFSDSTMTKPYLTTAHRSALK